MDRIYKEEKYNADQLKLKLSETDDSKFFIANQIEDENKTNFKKIFDLTNFLN